MVRINRVVTRGGDKGDTSLGDGARVRKDDIRVTAMGAVDEANAAIGALRAAGLPADADAMVARVQNDLFDLGADLCVPLAEAAGERRSRLRLTDAPSVRLEAEVAALNAGLPPLRSFVLPGGTLAASRAHVARTIVRRAEREVVRLAAEQPVNPALVRYLNRLSDHLFVLARTLNGGGAGDVLWVPGGSDDMENPQQDQDRDRDSEQP
jgi:cob(I)alamin adenosyltransferase